jgi:hypothetical protein
MTTLLFVTSMCHLLRTSNSHAYEYILVMIRCRSLQHRYEYETRGPTNTYLCMIKHFVKPSAIHYQRLLAAASTIKSALYVYNRIHTSSARMIYNTYHLNTQRYKNKYFLLQNWHNSRQPIRFTRTQLHSHYA